MKVSYLFALLIVFAGAISVLLALKWGVPDLEPIFFYESMNTQIIFDKGQGGHPIYSTQKSGSHERFGKQEYFNRKKSEKVIFFMIPGNMGGFIQIPPIVNSIENYTAYMNEQQNEIHYYSDSYGFDF